MSEQDQKPVRVAISKRLRFEVFKRDRFAHRKGFAYFCGICWNKIRDKEGR